MKKEQSTKEMLFGVFPVMSTIDTNKKRTINRRRSYTKIQLCLQPAELPVHYFTSFGEPFVDTFLRPEPSVCPIINTENKTIVNI